MLSEKPWKPEAMLRLLTGGLVCLCVGNLLNCTLQYCSVGGKVGGRIFFPTAGAAAVFLAAALVVLSRPFPLNGFLRRVLAAVGCFYAGFFCVAWMSMWAASADVSTGRLFLGTMATQVLWLVLTAWFVREHEVSWADAFGLANLCGQAVLWGIVVAAIFLPVGWCLQQISALVMTHVGHLGVNVKPEEQMAVQALREAASWRDRAVGGLVTIVLAPVAEELGFRGILYPWVKFLGFPRLAFWGTAVLFGAIHLNLPSFVPLSVLALALTLLYERTNNLLAPIAAHGFVNAFNFALLLWFP